MMIKTTMKTSLFVLAGITSGSSAYSFCSQFNGNHQTCKSQASCEWKWRLVNGGQEWSGVCEKKDSGVTSATSSSYVSLEASEYECEFLHQSACQLPICKWCWDAKCAPISGKCRVEKKPARHLRAGQGKK